LESVSEPCALIRGVFHVDPRKLSEDEFVVLWAEAKHYLTVVHQVKFN